MVKKLELFDTIINWLQFISIHYFGPVLSLIFILIKITIKQILRACFRLENDIVEILLWFSVDISMLSLAVSVTFKLHDKLLLNYQTSFLWYVVIIIIIFSCAVIYAGVLKLKEKVNLFVRSIIIGLSLFFTWSLSIGLLQFNLKNIKVIDIF